MTEENEMDRKRPGSPIKGMSLYASSADYERRLSEDLLQAPEPNMVDESEADDA